MCILYNESDADESRRGHDFGTVGYEGEEDGHQSLAEPVHPQTQTLAQESDGDARLEHHFRPQVFETADECKFQILKAVDKVLKSPVCGADQHHGPDAFQVLHPLFPVTGSVIQRVQDIAEF